MNSANAAAEAPVKFYSDRIARSYDVMHQAQVVYT